MTAETHLSKKFDSEPSAVSTVSATTASTVGGSLATTAATTTTPYGFSQAQADGLIARVNALIADVASVYTRLAADRTAINAIAAALTDQGITS